MPATTPQQKPIQLDWRDGGRPVVVSPADEDRFTLTVQEAAEACRQANTGIVWRKQFDELLAYIRGWLQRHQESVVAAYGSVSGGVLVFFVVPSSQVMNFELSDEIAQLEVELHHSFERCRCEVRQIPGRTYDVLSTFVDLEKTFLLYGDVATAQGSVAS